MGKDCTVVDATIDTVETKVDFGEDFKAGSDLTAECKTKRGTYGMKKASVIKKEWHKQIVEIEKWMAGKTFADIRL